MNAALGRANARAAELRGNPNVEYAEPNWIYRHSSSNDTYYTNGWLWGMYSGTTTPTNQFGSGAAAAWARGTSCNNVWVGIIDEGYMFTHTDLAANAGRNPAEIAGNGRDDDGNGLVDDVYGWDFDGNTSSLFDIVATNNSWGGGGFSQALQDAIERANAAGILFVAAAGNSTLNCETSNCYPAEYPNANVIAVASITSTGGLSSFSNFGSSTIDIGAPGSAVWSTVPAGSRRNVTSGYASYSGTSMASPHVAGAVGLYASRNPTASAAQIKTAILNAATATTSLSGRVLTNGRLNVSGF